MLHHIGVIRVPVDRHLGYAAAPECTHSALVLVAVRCHAAKSGHVRPSARLGRAVHHHGLCETVHSRSVRIHGGGYGKDPAHVERSHVVRDVGLGGNCGLKPQI